MSRATRIEHLRVLAERGATEGERAAARRQLEDHEAKQAAEQAKTAPSMHAAADWLDQIITAHHEANGGPPTYDAEEFTLGSVVVWTTEIIMRRTRIRLSNGVVVVTRRSGRPMDVDGRMGIVFRRGDLRRGETE